jgi:hypothetical protein
MRPQTARMRQLRRLAQVVDGQHAPPHGVLQRQKTGTRKMRIIGLDGSGDASERDRSVGFVLQGLRLDTAEHGGSALLIFIGVRFLPDQIFIASPAVRHQRGQIALGAGGEEQRPLVSKPLGHPGFEAIDGRVVSVHVIAHLGGGHRGAHGRRRPSHGVAAEIDDGAVGDD